MRRSTEKIMPAVTLETIRRLATVRPDHGNVLSLYLDLDPTRFPTPSARRGELDAMLSEARRLRGDDLSHDERNALDTDIERVGRYLSQKFAAGGARGVAVFCSSEAGLFEAIKLPRGVEPSATIADTPYVEPLASFVSDGDWCVLLVNRRTSRVLWGSADGLAEVETQQDDVPNRHEQGGWAQARFQRHVDEHIADHVKQAASRLLDRFGREPFAHLVVSCPDALWPQVEASLHRYLVDRVAGRVTVDVENASPREVLEASRPVVEEVQRRRERELLDQFDEGVGKGTTAVAGLHDVLQALHAARVGTLLIQDGFHGSGLERAVELAAEQAAELVTIRHHDDLRERGSIAALLRF